MVVPILPKSCYANTHDYTYDFYVHKGVYLEKHTLYVSIASSLYDYYRGKNHDFNNPAIFVTPDVLCPIAEDIWSICKEKPYQDEEFVNVVLMLVHQIPYEVSIVRYAIETLVNNFGDCDTLSYLAASIIKAGGLDVVLLEYEDQKHMNIGVHLAHI